MENGKQLITQADLDEVRGNHPGADIMPTLDGFEAVLGDLVLRRRTLPGLDMAVGIAETGDCAG